MDGGGDGHEEAGAAAQDADSGAPAAAEHSGPVQIDDAGGGCGAAADPDLTPLQDAALAAGAAAGEGGEGAPALAVITGEAPDEGVEPMAAAAHPAAAESLGGADDGPGAAQDATHAAGAAAGEGGAPALAVITGGAPDQGMEPNAPAAAAHPAAQAEAVQAADAAGAAAAGVAPESIGGAVGGDDGGPGTAQASPDGQDGADRAAEPAPIPPVGHARIWKARHNKWCEQTDSDLSWYEHKRHVLVFSYSGKPVYTRYGSEEGLSRTTGALSAIVSKFAAFFFSNPGGQSDALRYFTAGEHIFAFVERGPLWLVCISRSGDAYQDMVRLLERVHSQIVTLLTAGIERTLQNRPNYDMRKIMDGTDAVVNSLIRWCTQDMCLQVDGLEPLPLPPAARSAATDALRSARVPNVLCSWLMAEHRIVTLVSNKQYRVNSSDLSLIVNIVMSSTSLRVGESWTPVCLPHLNDKAFAYAYIHFIEGTDVGAVFLSSSSEGEQFYAISQEAASLKQTLRRNGCLDAIAHAAGRCPIDLRECANGGQAAGPDWTGEETPSAGVASSFLPPARGVGDRSAKKSLLAPTPPGQMRLLEGIIHAAYFVPSMQQYFSSAVAPAYCTRRRTKMLFRYYGRCRALLRHAKMPSQICFATDHECFYVSLANEYQMYLAVPRGISMAVIGQFYQWVKAQEAHIFVGSFPTW